MDKSFYKATGVDRRSLWLFDDADLRDCRSEVDRGVRYREYGIQRQYDGVIIIQTRVGVTMSINRTVMCFRMRVDDHVVVSVRTCRLMDVLDRCQREHPDCQTEQRRKEPMTH